MAAKSGRGAGSLQAPRPARAEVAAELLIVEGLPTRADDQRIFQFRVRQVTWILRWPLFAAASGGIRGRINRMSIYFFEAPASATARAASSASSRPSPSRSSLSNPAAGPVNSRRDTSPSPLRSIAWDQAGPRQLDERQLPRIAPADRGQHHAWEPRAVETAGRHATDVLQPRPGRAEFAHGQGSVMACVEDFEQPCPIEDGHQDLPRAICDCMSSQASSSFRSSVPSASRSAIGVSQERSPPRRRPPPPTGPAGVLSNMLEQREPGGRQRIIHPAAHGPADEPDAVAREAEAARA